MRRAIYPGSFDPVTNGHLDIIERCCNLFDEIVIAVVVNPEKKPLFTVEERQATRDARTSRAARIENCNESKTSRAPELLAQTRLD